MIPMRRVAQIQPYPSASVPTRFPLNDVRGTGRDPYDPLSLRRGCRRPDSPRRGPYRRSCCRPPGCSTPAFDVARRGGSLLVGSDEVALDEVAGRQSREIPSLPSNTSDDQAAQGATSGRHGSGRWPPTPASDAVELDTGLGVARLGVPVDRDRVRRCRAGPMPDRSRWLNPPPPTLNRIVSTPTPAAQSPPVVSVSPLALPMASLRLQEPSPATATSSRRVHGDHRVGRRAVHARHPAVRRPPRGPSRHPGRAASEAPRSAVPSRST